jgi:opacity protein-like surface antigen
VKSIALIIAFLGSLSAAGFAQESAGDDLWEPSSYRTIALAGSAPDPESAPLPRSLAADPAMEDPAPHFSIGPAGGYLRVRGADRGTWFGGAQARLRLAKILAAEAAITFHHSRYENGDVTVTQYPLQLTAMLYIIPEGPIQPYILGGVGWYYTRIDYKGLFSAIPDKTDHFFGVHLGAGAELMLGTSASLNADVRYIFVNATNEQVIRRDFNYWQITFGLNFYF